MNITPISNFNLEKHLSAEHKISPVSTYLKEIVYGGTDGIVTTFAIVAGFNGAAATSSQLNLPIFAVLLFGFANLVADGVSMGLGNFLSVRAEKDVYQLEKKKEKNEIQQNSELEKEETKQILLRRGFSKKDAETLTQIYAKNEDYWLDFMMHQELELPNPEKDNPMITGVVTTTSFVLFGFIPLITYLAFFIPVEAKFTGSVMFTLLALLMLGTLRWKVTKETLTRSVGETLLLGTISSTLAFIVGLLFRY